MSLNTILTLSLIYSNLDLDSFNVVAVVSSLKHQMETTFGHIFWGRVSSSVNTITINLEPIYFYPWKSVLDDMTFMFHLDQRFDLDSLLVIFRGFFKREALLRLLSIYFTKLSKRSRFVTQKVFYNVVKNFPYNENLPYIRNLPFYENLPIF